MLRKVWGYRKPRNSEAAAAALLFAFLALLATGVLGISHLLQPLSVRESDAVVALLVLITVLATVGCFFNSRKNTIF